VKKNWPRKFYFDQGFFRSGKWGTGLEMKKAHPWHTVRKKHAIKFAPRVGVLGLDIAYGRKSLPGFVHLLCPQNFQSKEGW